MTSLMNFKTVSDDFEVQFEIIPPVDYKLDSRQEIINEGKTRLDSKIQLNNKKIAELNKEISRLTNHADGIDYMVAVGSGILAGLIDSFWVGEFRFQRGKAWSNKTVNDFVMKAAKKQGYSGDRLDGAIKHLEDKFKIPSDNLFEKANKTLKQGEKITKKSHHLDDLAHHPSPVGLFFSILTQFTKKGYFSNNQGAFLPISVDETGLIGNDVPSKLFCGTVNWFFHLVSDMSGSNKTAGVGMGIPGPIVSLLKELSTIPGLSKTGLAKKMNNAFVKNKFDLRSEMAVAHELGRQAVPVMINEVIVRGFYFIRRLVKEVKEKGGFNEVEWKNCLPFNNRTIARMLTIASGTFVACDLIDATIRGAIKSGGNPALFAKEFLLRVNFVGVGRFVIAVVTDVKMGVKRSRLRNQRIALYNEQLFLSNSKIFYLQAEMWIAAEKTDQTINELFDLMEKSILFYADTMRDIDLNLDKIDNSIKEIEAHNRGFSDNILEVLIWG